MWAYWRLIDAGEAEQAGQLRSELGRPPHRSRLGAGMMDLVYRRRACGLDNKIRESTERGIGRIL